MKLLMTGGSGFIGTNLVAEAEQRGLKLLNIDINPPFDSSHQKYWQELNILEQEKLIKTFQSFQPDWVVHLAARTDCDENTTVEEGYKDNTEGTANVLSAIKATPTVKRVIITSTQFVFKSEKDLPKNDSDYRVHTVYGQSKVITEQLTREANLGCTWTIIRPTTIWGPWDLNYRQQFYTILRKGLYIHPGKKPCFRSYGYIGNLVFQVLSLLEADSNQVNRQVFYVGDKPINVLDWVNVFHMQLLKRKARVVPRSLIHFLAVIGDVISKIRGKRFFIDSSRFNSMIEEYPVPIESTFELLGESPYSLEESVKQTLTWLNEHYYNLK
jgi:nucleoside-diphosphate-sugar epimerase